MSSLFLFLIESYLFIITLILFLINARDISKFVNIKEYPTYVNEENNNLDTKDKKILEIEKLFKQRDLFLDSYLKQMLAT